MKIKTIFFVTLFLLSGVAICHASIVPPHIQLTADIGPGTGLPDTAGGIKGILTNILNFLLGMVGIIAIISFVVSGIQYFLAAGDETIMQTAKRNMLYSTIGIIIALSGFIVVRAIDAILNASPTI